MWIIAGPHWLSSWPMLPAVSSVECPTALWAIKWKLTFVTFVSLMMELNMTDIQVMSGTGHFIFFWNKLVHYCELNIEHCWNSSFLLTYQSWNYVYICVMTLLPIVQCLALIRPLITLPQPWSFITCLTPWYPWYWPRSDLIDIKLVKSVNNTPDNIRGIAHWAEGDKCMLQ